MGEGGLLGWSPGGRGAGGWRVILGGILAHLCLGTLYTVSRSRGSLWLLRRGLCPALRPESFAVLSARRAVGQPICLRDELPEDPPPSHHLRGHHHHLRLPNRGPGPCTAAPALPSSSNLLSFLNTVRLACSRLCACLPACLQSCLMYLGGLIEQRLGPRLTVMIGGSLVAGATALASTSEAGRREGGNPNREAGGS